MKKLPLIVTLLAAGLMQPLGAWAESIYTSQAPQPLGPYSQAVRAGDIVYISGQIALNPQTDELVSGDFRSQFKQALLNLAAVAKAAGGGLDNIVKVTIYVTDLNNFSTINEEMSAQFHKPYPARVVVEVKALPKQAAVEIEAVMTNPTKLRK